MSAERLIVLGLAALVVIAVVYFILKLANGV